MNDPLDDANTLGASTNWNDPQVSRPVMDFLANEANKLRDENTKLQARVKLLEGAMRDLIVFGGATLDPDDEESGKIAATVLSGAINRARVILKLSEAKLSATPQTEGRDA